MTLERLKNNSRERACILPARLFLEEIFYLAGAAHVSAIFLSCFFVLYETEELYKQRTFWMFELLRFVEPVVVLATHKKHEPLELTVVQKMCCLFLIIFGQHVA